MSGFVRRRGRTVRRWLRGVRARLVATFVLAAALAALVGVVLFAFLLSRTLDANVDTDLRATAEAFAADVRAGDVERIKPGPTIDAARAHSSLPTVVAIYRPSGELVDSEPAVLPAPPVNGRPEHVAPGLSTITYAHRSFRFYRLRVDAVGGTWLVVVGQNLGATSDANTDAQHVLYAIVPIAVLLSGIGAWLLSGAALRPVDRMRADVQQLSETRSPGNIGVPDTSDSLNKLAQTFNTLLGRLHTSLERQRDFVADAGHELRTPLAVLQTELETAVRPGRTRADLVDSIRHAQRETARLATLSEDLLLLAQADGPDQIVRPELVEPVEVIAQSGAAHGKEYEASGVTLRLPTSSGRDPVLAELDPVALRRALDNLLANALRHTPPAGTVEVTFTPIVHDGRDELEIAVQDTGEGFPPEFVVHAFERFARADRSRSRSSAASGSGLGLSIVATLVIAQGGSVMAENRPAGGARVVMTLPRHAS